MPVINYTSNRNYEHCFADDLIKMAGNHFKKQGARVTRAVKVAHMGRVMARRDFEKIAITKQVLGAVGGLGKNVQKVKVRRNLRAAAPGAGAIRNLPAKPPGIGFKPTPRAKPNIGSTVSPPTTAKPGMAFTEGGAGAVSGPAVGRPSAGPLSGPTGPGQLRGYGNVPTSGAVKSTPTAPQRSSSFVGKQTPPATQAGGRPATPPSPPSGGASPSNFSGGRDLSAGGTPRPQDNILARSYGKVRDVAGSVKSKLPSPESGAGKVLSFGKDVGLGALGAPTTTAAGAIAAPVVASTGRKLLQAGKKVLADRDISKQLKKQISGVSNQALKSTGQIKELGLANFDGAARRAAAKAGLSGRQLQSIDTLVSNGHNLPKGARKRLERAAGMSFDEISQAGSVSEAIKRHGSSAAGKVNVSQAAENIQKSPQEYVSDFVGEAKDKVVDAATSEQRSAADAPAVAGAASQGLAGRVGSFFNQPVGGPKTQLAMTAGKIAIPVGLGLGAYGAYQGMNQLANQNQQSQHQYGAMGAPINYNPTSMFPR